MAEADPSQSNQDRQRGRKKHPKGVASKYADEIKNPCVKVSRKSPRHTFHKLHKIKDAVSQQHGVGITLPRGDEPRVI